MKKVLFCILMVPFFVFADYKLKTKDKSAEIKINAAVMATTYCHERHTLGRYLFELNKKGDPKNFIPKIREQLGDELTDSILNYAKNEKKPVKQNQFLNERYAECVDQTIATVTSELQKTEN